jgi:polyribonucleotide nucleotidyltransferase
MPIRDWPGTLPGPWRFLKHMSHTVSVDLGGRTVTLETGRMAKQANGSVVVRSGDSAVLVSACMADQP